MPHLLLVEDDEHVAFAMSRLIKHLGYTSDHSPSLSLAFTKLATSDFDAVLLDLGLPDGDSMSLAAELAKRRTPFIVVSGRDEANCAVAAMKAGAADYLTKPYSQQALSAAIERASRHVSHTQMPKEAADGDSAAWRQTLAALGCVARAPKTPVLLLGETGTGKEVLARRLHAMSSRAQEPFVAVNAACLADAIVESELFGHEAGAFTDAKGTRRGVFELAHRGTLFLDEVGELPMPVQAKLLRVLESSSFRRVGGEVEIKVDVRIVAATHRSLDHAALFRPDLLQRLAVFEVHLPPLRERGRDVLTLADLLLNQLSKEMGIRTPFLSDEAQALLLSHAWPGNVRELKNALERALLTAGHHTVLEASDFALRRTSQVRERSLQGLVTQELTTELAKHDGNISATARALRISRNRLKRHLSGSSDGGSSKN